MITIQEEELQGISIKLLADVTGCTGGSQASRETPEEAPELEYDLYVQIDNLVVKLQDVEDSIVWGNIDYDEIDQIIIDELKHEWQTQKSERMVHHESM